MFVFLKTTYLIKTVLHYGHRRLKHGRYLHLYDGDPDFLFCDFPIVDTYLGHPVHCN